MHPHHPRPIMDPLYFCKSTANTHCTLIQKFNKNAEYIIYIATITNNKSFLVINNFPNQQIVDIM